MATLSPPAQISLSPAPGAITSDQMENSLDQLMESFHQGQQPQLYYQNGAQGIPIIQGVPSQGVPVIQQPIQPNQAVPIQYALPAGYKLQKVNGNGGNGGKFYTNQPLGQHIPPPLPPPPPPQQQTTSGFQWNIWNILLAIIGIFILLLILLMLWKFISASRKKHEEQKQVANAVTEEQLKRYIAEQTNEPTMLTPKSAFEDIYAQS